MTNCTIMSRRCLLAGGAAAGVAALTGGARASSFPAVVELFTSQGCSSCPPADEFAGELRRGGGVTVLTFHVDYWDYLGWKDTLGAPEFSQRQYDYAKARGDMEVYTPQMIVNGASHHIGNRRDEVLAAIAGVSAGWSAAVSLTEAGAGLSVEVAEAPLEGEAMVWLLPVQPEVTVKIERGEIAGQSVVSHNVVRRIVPAGMWNGRAARFTLPADTVIPPECTGCVAIVQRGKTGAVLGAASWGDVSA